MQRILRLRSLALGLLVGSALTASQANAQSGGTIVGKVIDRATNQPLSEVQLQLAGTVRGARTTDEGDYRITSVPAGTYTMRVIRIGYSQATQQVTVVAGQTVTANFSLSSAAVTIDQVVVTATGETQRRRESGATTTTISTENIPLPAVNNFSATLSSRAAGLTVINAGGTTGTNSRIRIRGANSINLNNEPLIIIDGVQVSNNANNFGVGLGGQTTSRWDDINPEDIENIEVIKGPSGTALYGSAASNGVIQITTKRGRAGKTRWNTYGEYGNIQDLTEYPANYQQIGRTPAGALTTCNLDSRGRGLCTPIADSLLSWNPLESVNPQRQGWREQYGLNASGGVNDATYYIGGEYEREQGIFEPNRLRRINFRTNVRAQLKPNLDANVSIGYTRSKSSLPFNDNTAFGALSAGLLGKAFDCSPTTYRTNLRCGTDSLSRGYFTSNVPSTDYFAVNNQQDISRLVLGTTVNYQPLSWLRGVARVGADISSRYDQQLTPPNRVAFSAASLEGSRFNLREEAPTFTGNGTLTATFDLFGGKLNSQTAVGGQYINEIIRQTNATGAVLIPGTSSLNGTSARFAVGESNQQVITVGGYVEQKLAWQDRFFLTGAVRADDNSNFGSQLGLIYYPAVSASWVMSEEDWFPKFGWLNQFRLRSAYGRSGNRPGFRQAETFFSPVSVRLGGAELPAVTVGGAGNSELNPEISEEMEGGFELNAFSGRVGLTSTYFNKKTNDALVSRVLAPSLGNAGSRFVNFAEVRNRGIEFELTTVPVDLKNVRYELQGTYTQVQNQLMNLGEGITPIIFGFNSSQRHTKGSPLGAYYLRDYKFNDANGDGVITRTNCPTIGGIANPQVAGGPACEVTLTDTAVYLGQPLPPREINVNQTLTLFRNLQVTALLNHRGGHKLFNSTREFRCSQFRNCQDIMDPAASLEDQAKVIGSIMGTVAGYIEDASFTRLREVAVTYTTPQRWASKLGFSNLGITFAGRNLAVWTDYSGFDPEVNSNATTNFTSADFLAQPPVRYFVVRLNANF